MTVVRTSRAGERQQPARPSANCETRPVTSLDALLVDIRSCTICADHLVDGPRPIVAASATSPIVIIGQAPGRRVHESGIPWDDPSGVTLRSWLGVTDDEFYDPGKVALVPMGFCFPGTGKSGDAPPRPECAPQWHEELLSHLPQDRLEVIIGAYAQARYIDGPKRKVTDVVADWEQHLPGRIVLPHPSPRNRRFLTQNPWFETDVLPAVRARVRQVLGD